MASSVRLGYIFSRLSRQHRILNICHLLTVSLTVSLTFLVCRPGAMQPVKSTAEVGVPAGFVIVTRRRSPGNITERSEICALWFVLLGSKSLLLQVDWRSGGDLILSALNEFVRKEEGCPFMLKRKHSVGAVR